MAEKTDLEVNRQGEAAQMLLRMARDYFDCDSVGLKLLKGDGSDRRIFLLSSSIQTGKSVIGVYHENLEENRSFIQITEKMKEAWLPVPEIIRIDESQRAYLLQYLGKYHLGQSIERWKKSSETHRIILAYKQVIRCLVKMQTQLTPFLKDLLKDRIMGIQDFSGDLAYFEHDFVHRFDCFCAVSHCSNGLNSADGIQFIHTANGGGC